MLAESAPTTNGSASLTSPHRSLFGGSPISDEQTATEQVIRHYARSTEYDKDWHKVRDCPDLCSHFRLNLEVSFIFINMIPCLFILGMAQTRICVLHRPLTRQRAVASGRGSGCSFSTHSSSSHYTSATTSATTGDGSDAADWRPYSTTTAARRANDTGHDACYCEHDR